MMLGENIYFSVDFLHVLEEKGDINKMNYLKSLNKKIYLADLGDLLSILSHITVSLRMELLLTQDTLWRQI